MYSVSRADTWGSGTPLKLHAVKKRESREKE